MSEKDPNKTLDDLQKQIRDMLGNANLSTFFTDVGAQAEPEETTGDAEPVEEDDEALKRIREFNLRPREVRDYLNRFVVKQAEGKKVLSVAICDHYNHVRQCLDNPDLRERDYAKQNVLLLGPTGVGKTYLMRCIAKLVGVPFVKADATKFSETGYVGHDADDLVRDLVKAANGDIELAQYGIIYIDEIDKIASHGDRGGRDVSGRGVQINLLKLMEETDVSLFSQTDMLGQMEAMMEMQRGGQRPAKRTINTRHILFIVSGAFDKLAEQVRRRLQSASIGFSSQDERTTRTDSEVLVSAETRDYIDYGFEPEFIGRLPVRVTCDSLSADDLEEILTTSEDNIVAQYRSDFRGYGIDYDLSPDAIREIAERAAEEGTGARGLMTVMEGVFRDFKFELPSTTVASFAVTKETIVDPKSALVSLLEESRGPQKELLINEVQAFADRFRADHGLEIRFDDDAVARLVDLSLEADKTMRALCEEKFHDFEHGLKLVARNSGRTAFLITGDMIDDPATELSQWIVESFRRAKPRETPDPDA